MAPETTIQPAATEVPEEEPFTRADYMQLPEGFRAILLEGSFVREPAPTWGHQEVVGQLYLAAASAVGRRALIAPADVVIDDLNVLQPDVLVLGPDVPRACGADPETVPILVMDVLSRGTARRDREQKTALYVRGGVQEVWLVDPANVTIDVVTSSGVEHHDADSHVESRAVPGLSVTPRAIVQPEG